MKPISAMVGGSSGNRSERSDLVPETTSKSFRLSTSSARPFIHHTRQRKYYGTGWLNTEARAYTFVAGVGSSDDDAALTETYDSRARRGKEEPSFSKEQQEKLFHEGHLGWESQGLGNALKI